MILLQPTKSFLLPACRGLILLQIEQMKKLIGERKRKLWAEVGAIMGKSGARCQSAAKEAKLSFEMFY